MLRPLFARVWCVRRTSYGRHGLLRGKWYFLYVTSVPFLFWSRLKKWPMSLREFSTIISNIQRIQNTMFSVTLFSHSRSLCTDMKIIFPWKCSSSHFISVIIFWISVRIPNVVNPRKIFHSNSIGSPSIRPNSPNWRDSMNQLIFSFLALTGSVLMPARHSTESDKTKVFAVANWTALSVSKVVLCHVSCCQLSTWKPVISFWSVISFPDTWNNCFNDRMDCFLVERGSSE